MPNTYRIHPSVGVARVGNLDATGPDDFFIGPESPGHSPVPPGGYKKAGAIRRQGARFRVYEYTPDPQTGEMIPAREITAADARIEWTVRLGNRKAFGSNFPPSEPGVRNSSIQDEAERRRLLILEAEAEIASDEAAGAHRSLDAFFLDEQETQPESHRVHLGDLLLDNDGCLIVLGGLGRSFSPTGRPIHDTFNNDEWCDDTSDGVVTATVTMNGSGEPITVDFPARLLVGPPDFAPAIGNVVTLYDVAEDIAAQAGQLPGAAAGVSFARHIYPILRHVAQMRWVNQTAENGHGEGQGGDFLDPDLLALMRDPDIDPTSRAFRARRRVVSRLRVPAGVTPPADLPTGSRNMPRLQRELDTQRELTLTPLQYERMILWWRGQFDPDPGVDLDSSAPSFEQITDPREQVRALDRAGLDSCVGGSFFPGIEGPRRLREPDAWEEPFRLSSSLAPGEITEGLALPWQTDFLACDLDWWPPQRPNQVRVRNPAPPGNLIRAEWDRQSGGVTAFTTGTWARMGFVVPDGAAFVEAERDEVLEPPGAILEAVAEAGLLEASVHWSRRWVTRPCFREAVAEHGG